MAGEAYKVTMANFESVVDSHALVVLDFWAAWCAPCQAFAPIFDELARRHPEVFFGKVNIDEARDLAQAFQIRSIPTMMVFKHADLIFEKSGLVPPHEFERLIEQWRV